MRHYFNRFGCAICVGHSWGRAIISEVGDDPKDAGLVQVAAYVPDPGTSGNETSALSAPRQGRNAIQVGTQHFASISSEGVLNSFAEGLPMAERRLILAGQGQIYGPMFDEKLTHAAWKSNPSVIAAEDHTLSPAMEEAGAKNAAEGPSRRQPVTSLCCSSLNRLPTSSLKQGATQSCGSPLENDTTLEEHRKGVNHVE